METNSYPVPCPLCGKDKFSVLYNRNLGQFSEETESYQMTTDHFGNYGRVVRCRECRFVYQNPRYKNEFIEKMYGTMEDHDYLSEQDSRSINAHISMQTIRRYKESGRFLDIGCATGFLLNAARFSFDVEGLELSSWAVNYAQKTLKLDVKKATLESYPFPDNYFDVISMVDVIEHVADPKEDLKRILKMLKPGGLLYMVTPDVGSLSSKVLGSYWWGLRMAHLTYFSTKTMRRMLEEVGFEVHDIRSYGRIFTYGYWLSRLKSYPSFIYKLVGFFVRLFGIEQKIVYINTRDAMEVCAGKR